MKDDLTYQEIVEMLKGYAEQIAVDYMPNGYKSGKYWKGDLHGKASVHISGHQIGMVGFWQGQRSGSNGGNLINLIEIGEGCSSHGEAVGIAKRKYLGIQDRPPTKQELQSREQSKQKSASMARQREIENLADRQRRSESAKHIWQGGIAIKNTLAELYLRKRGITADPLPPSLRFHPSCTYALDGNRAGARRMPALICGVQDKKRALIGVWQIYLDPTDGTKAKLRDGESAKLGRGPTSGGCVRLGPITREVIVAEGVETALAAHALHNDPNVSAMALLSTSGMIAWDIPDEIKHIRIYADGDTHRIGKKDFDIVKPPGLEAAERLADRARGKGIKVDISLPPEGSDWLDVWNLTKDFQ